MGDSLVWTNGIVESLQEKFNDRAREDSSKQSNQYMLRYFSRYQIGAPAELVACAEGYVDATTSI